MSERKISVFYNNISYKLPLKNVLQLYFVNNNYFHISCCVQKCVKDITVNNAEKLCREIIYIFCYNVPNVMEVFSVH